MLRLQQERRCLHQAQAAAKAVLPAPCSGCSRSGAACTMLRLQQERRCLHHAQVAAGAALPALSSAAQCSVQARTMQYLSNSDADKHQTWF